MSNKIGASSLSSGSGAPSTLGVGAPSPPTTKPVTFEGAGPQAQAVSEENCHRCGLCPYVGVFASEFAYLRKSDYEFHKSDNAEVAAAAGSRWQQATKEKVVYACYQCGQKHHNKTYMKEDGRLTSEWINSAKRSRYEHSNFHLMQRKADAEGGSKQFSSQEFLQNMKSARFEKSSDWVVQISPFSFQLFGCAREAGGCGTYPLKNGNFYRFSNLDSALGSQQSGFWACGPCLKRWTWGADGRYQMIIVCDPENFENNLCAYLGDAYIDDQIKQELAVLKGSAVLEQIGSQPINTNTILRALEVLGERAERQLMKRFATEMVTAAPIKTKFATPLFCEDPI